jgi:hypothetical protein
MHIDYEISEQDFLDAQKLAIKNSPNLLTRLTRVVLPLFGAALMAFVSYSLVTQGFSWNLIPAAAFPLLLLALPGWSKRIQKKPYAKAVSMHGLLALDVDEMGMQFQGPTVSSKVTWSHFSRFYEDEKVFILYQHMPVFNLIPKRILSPEQVIELRSYLRVIGKSSEAESNKLSSAAGAKRS